MRGLLRFSDAIAVGTRFVVDVTIVPSDTSPLRPARNVWTSSCALCTSHRALRARRASISPYHVATTPRACLSKSGTPSVLELGKQLGRGGLADAGGFRRPQDRALFLQRDQQQQLPHLEAREVQGLRGLLFSHIRML